ncbi:diguanylate cyclase domain-containing protein [Egibacter rhizosphaerae]|uniref:diguanylate cyclase domain-containing protein n=1 Tax=Egibacter rhizosphaerae TaxID=1670831 RepID=UPI0013F15BA2|nr:diguanylate cyclase [Egibacter rhizosphaerae]
MRRGLRRRLAEPIHLAHIEFVVSASLGIAVDGGTARTPDQLLNAADQDMYVEKARSRAVNPAPGLRGHRDTEDA